MISAGRKWVQTVMSGLKRAMKRSSGPVLSRSSMSRMRSVFHGSSVRVVDDAEDGRRLLHELDVELGIEVAKEAVGEAQRVDIAHFADAGLLAENFLQRLGRADVARAGAGGENQDAAAFGLERATFRTLAAAGCAETACEIRPCSA